MTPQSLASEIEKGLIEAEAAVLTKDNPAAIAAGCKAMSRIQRLLDILRLDNTAKSRRAEFGSRHRSLQMAMSDAVGALDERDLRSRILRTLRTLGPSSTAAITMDVQARVTATEEARVQLLHALGRDFVLSWPDHHAHFEVAAMLHKMRSDGLVERQWAWRHGFHWRVAERACANRKPAISIAA